MTAYTFFYAGLTLMVLHEMDAVRCREWRIFPGLSALPDRRGFQVFMLAHVPLLFLLLRALPADGAPRLVLWLDVFFMVHVALHLLFLRHPRNEFRDLLSWSLIIGAGVFGVLDLL